MINKKVQHLIDEAMQGTIFMHTMLAAEEIFHILNKEKNENASIVTNVEINKNKTNIVNIKVNIYMKNNDRKQNSLDIKSKLLDENEFLKMGAKYITSIPLIVTPQSVRNKLDFESRVEELSHCIINSIYAQLDARLHNRINEDVSNKKQHLKLVVKND